MAHELGRAVSDLPRLRSLLEAGKHRDQLERALIDAAASNALEAAGLLLDHGAKVNAPHAFGRSALFYASTLEMIELLISRGADVARRASNHDVVDDPSGEGRRLEGFRCARS